MRFGILGAYGAMLLGKWARTDGTFAEPLPAFRSLE